jgi:NadR type nicotinamide-nucleotide adenylyltransferase
MSITTICVAGAESTGKSWLAAKVAAHFGVVAAKEYARDYCAKHGNALTMAQLVHIAQVQNSNIHGTAMTSLDRGAGWVVADTDAVVTAVWARFSGEPLDPWFGGDLFECDLYLVMENDLPWQDDGVRIQSEQRQRDRFRTALTDELDRRGLRWVGIAGTGDQRFERALAAIAANAR